MHTNCFSWIFNLYRKNTCGVVFLVHLKPSKSYSIILEIRINPLEELPYYSELAILLYLQSTQTISF